MSDAEFDYYCTLKGPEPAGHHDPIGAMGRPAWCPNCGSRNIEYTSAIETSICKDCGWDNFLSALRNIEKRIANGEIYESTVIEELGCHPSDITEYKGRKIYKCPCCKSYFYLDP